MARGPRCRVGKCPGTSTAFGSAPTCRRCPTSSSEYRHVPAGLHEPGMDNVTVVLTTSDNGTRGRQVNRCKISPTSTTEVHNYESFLLQGKGTLYYNLQYSFPLDLVSHMLTRAGAASPLITGPPSSTTVGDVTPLNLAAQRPRLPLHRWKKNYIGYMSYITL
jgi:hypothetical protein